MRWLAEPTCDSIMSLRVLLLKCYTRIIFLVNLQDQVLYRTFPHNIRHVLLVCKGNICRSPLAAAYIKSRLMERGHRLTVRSAGLETTPGREAHPLARLTAQNNNLSLQEHITTSLNRTMVDVADLILVMELTQQIHLLRLYPDSKGKVFRLGQFSGKNAAEIVDPYNGTIEDFDTCYQMIHQSCDNLLQRINTAS